MQNAVFQPPFYARLAEVAKGLQESVPRELTFPCKVIAEKVISYDRNAFGMMDQVCTTTRHKLSSTVVVRQFACYSTSPFDYIFALFTTTMIYAYRKIKIISRRFGTHCRSQPTPNLCHFSYAFLSGVSFSYGDDFLVSDLLRL